MDGANARAGQHGEAGFQNHRHIDRNAVAFLDAMGFQDIGKAADLAMEFTIGQLFRRARTIRFPDDRCFVAACFEVTVQAVFCDVQNTVRIPFDIEITFIPRNVLGFRVRGHPIKTLALFRPKTLRVCNRARIHLAILLRR